MTKAFVQIKQHSVSVETWLSGGNQTELSSIPNPRPADIRHHIKVYWTAGYTTDFKVYGYIAQKHPPLSFSRGANSANSADWDEKMSNVVSDAEETCTMQIDQGQLASRVQCVKVEFNSAWTGWTSVLSNPLEIQVPVS